MKNATPFASVVCVARACVDPTSNRFSVASATPCAPDSTVARMLDVVGISARETLTVDVCPAVTLTGTDAACPFASSKPLGAAISSVQPPVVTELKEKAPEAEEVVVRVV